MMLDKRHRTYLEARFDQNNSRMKMSNTFFTFENYKMLSQVVHAGYEGGKMQKNI